MSSFCMITTTFPNEESAKTVIHLLFEQRLVACIQLLPIQSFYRRDAAFCEDSEVLLLMKTQTTCYEAIESLLIQHHPYKTPQLLQIPIDKGLSTYLSWMADETIKP